MLRSPTEALRSPGPHGHTQSEGPSGNSHLTIITFYRAIVKSRPLDHFPETATPSVPTESREDEAIDLRFPSGPQCGGVPFWDRL